MQITNLGYSRTVEIQNNNKRLLQKYYFFNQDSQAVIIVYDVTDPSSFQ